MSQNAIKLSEWAKQKGLTYKGVWRMYRAGDLPCHSEQLPSGTILVYPDQPSKALGKDRVALYARISPSDTETDLEQQMDRLRNFAAAKGLCADVEKSEIWSGVDFVSVPDKVITVPISVGVKENFHVAKRTDIAFYEILADPTIKTVVVENMSRLPVLCAEGIEFAMRAAGRSLLLASNVVNKISLDEMLDVVRELCEKHFDNSRTANYVAHCMLDRVKEYETVDAERLIQHPNATKVDEDKDNPLCPRLLNISKITILSNLEQKSDSTEIKLFSYQDELVRKVITSVAEKKNELFIVRWPRQSGKKEAVAELLVRLEDECSATLIGDTTSLKIVKMRTQSRKDLGQNKLFIDIKLDMPDALHSRDLIVVCTDKDVPESQISQIMESRDNCTILLIGSQRNYEHLTGPRTSSADIAVSYILQARREHFQEHGDRAVLSYEENVLRELPLELL